MRLYKSNEHDGVIPDLILKVYWGGLVLVLLIMIWGGIIVRLVAPPAYAKAEFFLPFLLFSALFQLLWQLLSVGIFLSAKSKYVLVSAVISMAFYAVLGYVLAEVCGPLGIGIALVSYSVFMCFVVNSFSQKLMPMPVALGQAVIISFVVAGLVFAFVDFCINKSDFFMGLLLRGVASMGLMGVLSWLYRDEVKGLLSLWQKRSLMAGRE